MQTVINKIPKDFPNIYFYDHHNHKYPTITFIWFAITPSGRRGTDFEQFRIYIKPDCKFAKMNINELALYALNNVTLHKLRKGYKWGDMMIQHNFLSNDMREIELINL